MPAKFKGIEFNVNETSTDGGKRIVTHEFPFQDEPFNEDLGRKARIYNLTGYVIGDNWESDRDRLIKAFESNGVGTLFHPDFGEIQCHGKTFKTDESKVTANKMCSFEFTFVEGGTQSRPTSITDTQKKLRLSIVEQMAELSSVFKATYNIVSKPQFITDTMVSIVGDVSKELLKTTSPVLNNLVTELTEVDVRDTVKLAEALHNTFVDDSDVSLLSNVFDVVTTKTIPLTTSNRTVENNNQQFLVTYIKNLSILSDVKNTSYVEFESYDDAIAVMDDTLVKLDAQIDESDGQTYESLSKIKTDFVSDINTRAPELSRIVNKSFYESFPALVLAYDFYGDATRESEIVKRNNITNPLYAGSSNAMEFLSD